jgi:hypothetical protein
VESIPNLKSKILKPPHLSVGSISNFKFQISNFKSQIDRLLKNCSIGAFSSVTLMPGLLIELSCPLIQFGCISGRVLKFSVLFFSGAIAALVHIDENRLLKRLYFGDSGIRLKAAYPRERPALVSPELP